MLHPFHEAFVKVQFPEETLKVLLTGPFDFLGVIHVSKCDDGLEGIAKDQNDLARAVQAPPVFLMGLLHNGCALKFLQFHISKEAIVYHVWKLKNSRILLFARGLSKVSFSGLSRSAALTAVGILSTVQKHFDFAMLISCKIARSGPAKCEFKWDIEKESLKTVDFTR